MMGGKDYFSPETEKQPEPHSFKIIYFFKVPI